MTNAASEATTPSRPPRSVHAGSLRIAGDAALSAVQADVTFTDDGHLLVTSVGMILADWPLADVEINSEQSATAFLRGDDLLVFEPVDVDVWNEQLAAYRLRTRLVGSPLAARGETASMAPTDSEMPVVAQPARGADVPVVQVMQSTAVITPRRTSHWLHLLLTVVTFGFWLPIWIGVSIFTGVVNSRSQRPVHQVARTPRPLASAPAVALKDPDAIRDRNNSLFKKVGIGAGVIVLLGILGSVVSSGQAPAADAATSSSTAAVVSATTSTTRPPAEESASAPTTTKPSTVGSDSAAILGGTSGMLRTVLMDLMDSSSCDDLEFDLKFATDNYSFDSQQAERMLKAVEYAQERGIDGTTCGGLSPYLSELNASL